MITVFEQELEKGTGVPYLLLKKGCIQPSAQIEEILYANIIENKAYDPQCEGSRSEYLYDLLELYPHREKIDERVIAYFNTMDDNLYEEIQYDVEPDTRVLANKRCEKQLLKNAALIGN